MKCHKNTIFKYILKNNILPKYMLKHDFKAKDGSLLNVMNKKYSNKR